MCPFRLIEFYFYLLLYYFNKAAIHSNLYTILNSFSCFPSRASAKTANKITQDVKDSHAVSNAILVRLCCPGFVLHHCEIQRLFKHKNSIIKDNFTN